MVKAKESSYRWRTELPPARSEVRSGWGEIRMQVRGWQRKQDQGPVVPSDRLEETGRFETRTKDGAPGAPRCRKRTRRNQQRCGGRPGL